METDARKKAAWLRKCLTDCSTMEIEEAARDAADELDRLAGYLEAIEQWRKRGEELFNAKEGFGVAFFHAGAWWADRPWRKR